MYAILVSLSTHNSQKYYYGLKSQTGGDYYTICTHAETHSVCGISDQIHDSYYCALILKGQYKLDERKSSTNCKLTYIIFHKKKLTVVPVHRPHINSSIKEV